MPAYQPDRRARPARHAQRGERMKATLPPAALRSYTTASGIASSIGSGMTRGNAYTRSTSAQTSSACRKSRLNLAMPPKPPKPSVSSISTRRPFGHLMPRPRTRACGSVVSRGHAKPLMDPAPPSRAARVPSRSARSSIHLRTGVVNPVFGRSIIAAGIRSAQAARSRLVGGDSKQWPAQGFRAAQDRRMAHALPRHVPCSTNRYREAAGCACTSTIRAQRSAHARTRLLYAVR